jgi:SAM-dependent methyltransferase
VRGCIACGHRHADLEVTDDHVRRVYSDEYFSGGGAGYANYLAEAPLLRRHGRRYARRLARFTTPGRVLDVGAAAGFVLEGLLDAGWTGTGIEPNEAMATRAANRLRVPIHRGTLIDFPGDETFDLLLMIQIIGHFTDLLRELEAAARHTRVGGYWLVETWDRESPAARLLGRRWHEYNPPSVVHWFSPGALRGLVRRFGFTEVARGRPLKLLNGAHARSLLAHQIRLPILAWLARPTLSLIPEKLSLPYYVGDLFWALFRKET